MSRVFSTTLLAVVSGAVITATLASPGAVSAAPAAPATNSALTAVTKPATASQPVTVKAVAEGVLKVWPYISGCQKNLQSGRSCTWQPSLRTITDQLDKIEKQIQANHKELVGFLGNVQASVDSIAKTQYAVTLGKLQANTKDAVKSWDALTKCVEAASEGKKVCQPYNAKLEKAEAIDSAMTKTQHFMLNFPLANLSSDVRLVAQNFAGSAMAAGQDGLAYKIWVESLGKYDRAQGVPADVQAVKTMRFVTHDLAKAHVRQLEEWTNELLLYGFFLPMKELLKATPDELSATALQNLVDTSIYGNDVPSSEVRFTVKGAFDALRIPLVPVGMIAYSDGKEAWKTTTKKSGLQVQPMSRDNINAAGKTIVDAKYTPSKVLPKAQFGVNNTLLIRTRPYYHSGKYAVCIGTSQVAPCDPTRDAAVVKTVELSSCTPGALPHGNTCKNAPVVMKLTDALVPWLSMKAEASPYGAWVGTCADCNPGFKVSYDKYVSPYSTYEWTSYHYHSKYASYIAGPGTYVQKTVQTYVKRLSLDNTTPWLPELMK